MQHMIQLVSKIGINYYIDVSTRDKHLISDYYATYSKHFLCILIQAPALPIRYSYIPSSYMMILKGGDEVICPSLRT